MTSVRSSQGKGSDKKKLTMQAAAAIHQYSEEINNTKTETQKL
jgi:hypothetical protein